jgi:FkbM family methyltransferase
LINTVELAIGGVEPFQFNFDDANGLDTVAADVNRSGLVYYEVPFPTVLGALVCLNNLDFFDVGANTGIFSLLAAAANPRINVTAFEPVPGIADLLATNLTHNPALADRIALERIALSESDGSFMMAEHINPAGHIATSSTLEMRLTEHDVNHKAIEVEVCRLDSWMVQNPKAEPGVFKVDVEGHERAFFEGALKTIRRFRPFIVVELLGGADFEYFERFLYMNNYRDIAMFPGMASLQERPSFLSDAWNHLFCPQEQMWTFATVCNRIGLPIS